METNIQLFSNPVFGEIRTAGTSEKPLFCLADLCKVLGLSNPSDVKSRLNEKGLCITDTPTTSGIQQMIFIDEPNLYKCIFQSRKPDAESFQNWVTSEVIPSIRKHGAYATPITIEAVISDPEFGIKLLSTLKEERIQREIIERQKIELERRNSVMLPKVKFFDTVIEPANECIDIGQAAKILKLPYGRNTLFRILREKGIFFKNKNEPKQEYIERGYFKLYEKTIPRSSHPALMVITVLVTQKGLLFLSKLLKTEIEEKAMAVFQ